MPGEGGGAEPPPSAPARRDTGVPPAGPAAPGSPPDAAARHDVPYDLCHSPRTKWRDLCFGRFLLWLLHLPSSQLPTPGTQLGPHPRQFLAPDRATKGISNCYNIKQILFELL